MKKQNETSFLIYQGPGDQGRVQIILSSDGRAEVSFEKHPMVPTQEKPWKKTITLPSNDFSRLLGVFKNLALTHQPDKRPMRPGSDFVEKSFSWFLENQDQPQTEVRFIETPQAFQSLMNEMKAIYDRAKSSK